MGIDVEWARAEFATFLKLTDLHRRPDPPGVAVMTSRLSNRGSQEEIIASAHVVEQVLDRVLPDWQASVDPKNNPRVNWWVQHREPFSGRMPLLSATPRFVSVWATTRLS
ncbi:hypothetical protein ACWEPM_33985 [Streptomyces sp. NPDC004244]